MSACASNLVEAFHTESPALVNAEHNNRDKMHDEGRHGMGFLGPSTASSSIWEFPKIRGTLLGGSYNKDPTI